MRRAEGPGPGTWRLWALFALGLGVCAALWATGPAEQSPGWALRFVRGYTVAWACYLAAALLVRRGVGLPKRVLLLIVVMALAARVVALVFAPPLSTDVWRYLWDGRVACAGTNPYRYSPEAPEVAFLRDGNWRRINFREIPTIYPPAAEVLFAGLARVRSADAEAFRWAFLLLDMGSVLLLIALLRRTGLAPERVIWYAWCPLPITEVTAGAHVDALGLFLLLTALLLSTGEHARARVGSAAALAGAVLSKGFALLALPFWLRRTGRRGAALLAWFIGVSLLLLLPFAGARGHLFGGLREYLSRWQANASLFTLCDWALEGRGVAEHYAMTRVISTIAILLVVGWLAWRQREGAEARLLGVFTALGAMVLLGAPALPWYALWSLPLLCWRQAPGWVAFSLTVSAQYYLRWPYPEQAVQLVWVGYGAVYGLLVVQAVGGWRRDALGPGTLYPWPPLPGVEGD